jgi:antitoxin (DNA-binding transcriptional repressor) of toxin-antitoxin stability system
MGEPATPIRRRLELSIAEARLRFQQLVRVTGVTGQVTVVVDGGRPIAAIVPVTDLHDTAPPAGVPPARPAAAPPPAPPPLPAAVPSPAGPPAQRRPVAPIHAGEGSAGGWLRRIEKVREDVRRQHASQIRELAKALDEAWQALDAARPAGTDRVVDTLRAAHVDLRPPR